MAAKLNTPERVEENRLRRVALRRGMHIEKSRRRDERALDFNGYMLIDNDTNGVILGGSPYAFSADLEAIRKYLED